MSRARRRQPHSPRKWQLFAECLDSGRLTPSIRLISRSSGVYRSSIPAPQQLPPSSRSHNRQASATPDRMQEAPEASTLAESSRSWAAMPEPVLSASHHRPYSSLAIAIFSLIWSIEELLVFSFEFLVISYWLLLSNIEFLHSGIES